MTLEEKVGQLFCPICVSAHPEYLKNEIMRFHVGGMLFKTSPSKDVRTALDYMQSSSKVPMLCTANLEYGSTGMLEDGTFFAQQMAVGASGKDLNAYRLGLVSCKEAAAVAQPDCQRQVIRRQCGRDTCDVQSLYAGRKRSRGRGDGQAFPRGWCGRSGPAFAHKR